MEVAYNRDTEGAPQIYLTEGMLFMINILVVFIGTVTFKNIFLICGYFETNVFLKSYQLLCASFGSKGTICIT